jgi:hypothetical protein
MIHKEKRTAERFNIIVFSYKLFVIQRGLVRVTVAHSPLLYISHTIPVG